MRFLALFLLLLTSKITFAQNRFEKEILALEQKDKTEKYSKKSILFVGSSSIRLWKTINEDMAPLPVIQRGFGGSNFTDLNYYIERLAYPHKLRAVVLFIANDITGSADDKTPAEVLDQFKLFESKIKAKYKKKPIFFIAITPNPLRWKVWNNINAANELIKTYCVNNKNLYYIDTVASYIGKDGLPISKYFVSDGLHQNADGYKVWTSIIKNQLIATLK